MPTTLVEHHSQQFRAEPAAAGAARRVVERLRADLGHERCRAACLLVTELVANAVKHGSRGPDDTVTVRVCKSPSEVRVGVIDCGPGLEPRPRERPPDLPESGFGLYLVEQVADRWGVESEPREVWFELDIGDPTTPAERFAARRRPPSAGT